MGHAHGKVPPRGKGNRHMACTHRIPVMPCASRTLLIGWSGWAEIWGIRLRSLLGGINSRGSQGRTVRLCPQLLKSEHLCALTLVFITLVSEPRALKTVSAKLLSSQLILVNVTMTATRPKKGAKRMKSPRHLTIKSIVENVPIEELVARQEALDEMMAASFQQVEES